MEEFIERVSDILRSPVILKRWQLSYRQALNLCLAMFVFLFATALNAEEGKISRYNFVMAVYERIFNRHITEMEATESGLIDQFDDGQYNLDWPISRGMAAEGLYRLSMQLGTAARLPRAFADIGNNSIFKKPLETVGGAFLPRNRGRFDPNYLLDRPALFHAISVLLDKGVLRQEDRSRLAAFPALDPVETISRAATDSITADNEAMLVSVRPELGFKEQSGGDPRYRAETYSRIANANARVSPGQMNPQEMASVEDASDAMKDVELLLDRLGGSVMEMSETYPSNPDDETVLRQGLAQIDSVLSAAIERFSHSKLQLNTAMPVDPDQIRKCEQLNRQLDLQLERLNLLKKRIAGRLAEPQKVEN
ncbi:MAG: hypothetical protein CVV41_14915 [Candidatus Riflebacteria bacterium HGW-Riflebacteria-1]|jgi:hypothetical protein|nr:MAG: hypothetical protein CVV41_14915 [Candidatus Riflebacteria bacterium HGW-Riflebacteria-1]